MNACADTEPAMQLVLTAMKGVLVYKNASLIDLHWPEAYVEHNPDFPDGCESLRMVASLVDMRYELGMVIALVRTPRSFLPHPPDMVRFWGACPSCNLPWCSQRNSDR